MATGGEGVKQVLQLEAEAVCEGLRLAIDTGMHAIEVETDVLFVLVDDSFLWS